MKKCLGLVVCMWVMWMGAVHAETLDLGNIVVTPNRVAEDVAHAPSNVSVIGRYEIERSNAGTVGEVLKSVAGVDVTNHGSSYSTEVDIRGYGDASVSNVLVLVNGRRTNSMDMSGPDWQQIPLDSVEQVEIIRGGASVMYGDKATGGVINIITKEGIGKDSVALFSEFGSYNSMKAAMEASGAREKLSYYIYSDYSMTDGYRDNSQIEARDAQVRTSYKLSDQVKFSLEGGWHREYYGLPGNLRDSDLRTKDRRDTRTPDDHGDTSDGFIKLSSDLIPWDASGEFGKLVVDYSHRERQTYDWYGPQTAFFSQKGLIKSDSVAVKHVWEHDVAGKGVSLITGMDYSDDRNHVLAGSPAGDGDNLIITKRSLGFYNNSEVELLENVFIDGGIRHESAKYIFDQYNVLAYNTQEPSVDAYSGGLRYDYAKGSNVFVKVQNTFRFLASDEWYQTWSTPPALNMDLEQQTGIEYQAGVKHNWNDTLDVSVTPFLSKNKKEIFYDYLNFLNSNYDRTRRKGVDVSTRLDMQSLVHSTFLSSWDILMNYSYLDARFGKGNYNGKVVPRVPAHRFSLGTDIGFPKGVTLNVTGRFIGSQYKNNDLRNEYSRTKPFIVADTKLSYKLKKNLDVYAGVNNVFNEKYNDYTSEDSGMSYNYPAPERNYIGGMKVRF